MLRYASSNNNGLADLTRMAIRLGTSIKVITAAIDILVASEAVSIKPESENILKIYLKSNYIV